MNNIEDTTPIEILASRVWGGTQWHYPNIEKMTTELRCLRAENLDLSAKVAACKDAGFIDEKGEVRKVLGTLPLTADGCVIGSKAWLWNIMPGTRGRDDDKPMRVCYKPAPIMDPDAYVDGPMRMYSTSEAAQAAAAKEVGNA